MKICIIAEGSYPYITGGVSSWIHQLVLNLPEHEFIILTLMPDSNKKGQFKYLLPQNIINYHEYFLDELINTKGKWNKKIKLNDEELDQLKKLLSFEKVDWDLIFSMFQKMKKYKLTGGDIQKSNTFYRELQIAYRYNYSHMPFTETYWTLKSMYIILFQLLLEDFPEADIYHAVSTGYAGFIGSIASKLYNKSFILTEHGIYTREREEEIIKASWVQGNLKDMWIKYFYQISDCAYESADKVISLFNYNREIQIEIGCPREKTEVIPNGVKIKDFEDVALEVSKRNDKEGINVGAVVRVVPIKDIITMLEAFSLVNKKINNINFYIMGPTDEEPEYYEECRKYRDYLSLYNVRFTGIVDVKEYFKIMDLLVLTSISEGQPLVILEGFASKIPYVSTDVGNCKQLILGDKDDFGPAGRVTKVMDSMSIAEAIVELCIESKKREKCGEAGYKRVKEFYKFDRFINKYKEIYNIYGLRV